MKVFGPVVIIAGFFWLGRESKKEIIGDKNAQGLMFDWGYWIAAHVPINKFMVVVVVTIASMLAAFDGWVMLLSHSEQALVWRSAKLLMLTLQ